MEEAKNCKVYVDVDVEFSSDGRMRPKWIRWRDGRVFEIDRVKQCVRAASRKAGSVGLRYTVVIGGQESQLYYEENYRWFVEAKNPQPCQEGGA
ncbi:MAG: hypothetical protein LUH07_01235 [Lachnospiraceae bacterium]|nr:hypothetical protein [Lachnospiraceae bacterium]